MRQSRSVQFVKTIRMLALGAFVCGLTQSGHAQMVADFSGSPTSGLAPLDVQFTDTSTGGAAVLWDWDFGDGITASSQSPSHTYTSAGTYTVTLSVLTFISIDTVVKQDYITVGPPTPIATDFTATPTSGDVPLIVQFTDTSTGNQPLAWLWDFGDGSTSNQQHPAHTYLGPGSYSVSLQTSLGDQSWTELKDDLIVVTPVPLVPQFTASPTEVIVGQPVSFFDASTGVAPTAWLWDFGDGNSSTAQDPVHVYTVPGTYTVSLSVSYFEQTETVVKTNLIDVLYLATLNVPGDATTIQGAIDLAADYTQILVAPGTYNEAINFGGKTLAVVGTAGASQTVIDASGLGTRPVTIPFGSGPGTILRGFHVTGGVVSNGNGGGVLVGASSPTHPTVRIIECQIVGNQAGHGGGVSGVDLDTSVEDCLVTGNIASNGVSGGVGYCRNVMRTVVSANVAYSGGGIAYCDFVEDCLVSGNKVNAFGGGILECLNVKRTVVSGNVSNYLGGGLAFCDFVEDCIISENQALRGGGAAYISDQVRGCLFDSNAAASGGGYYVVGYNSNVLEDSDSQFIDNLGGSIVIDVDCGANLSDLVVVQDGGTAVKITFSDCCGSSSYPSGSLSRTTLVGGGLEVSNMCYGQPGGGSLSVSECIIRQTSYPIGGWIDVSYSNITAEPPNANVDYLGKPYIVPPAQPWPGTGNINADPLFVDPDNLAYGLAPGSPCIDAGSPGSPLDEDGTIADMGALPFGRWLHLWSGLYGSHGIPLLEGAGDLTPGSETTLSLSHAREGSHAALVIGFSGISVPLMGGVLVPAPDVIIFGASVDDVGSLSFAAPWPPGLPSGITTYFQWWINDPTGVSGFAASNALSGTTP